MKELLVVIDMQNDFVTGSLGTKEACAITEKVRQKILSWTAEGERVVLPCTHGENYLETQEGRKLPITHCIRGSEGWEIIPQLQPFAGDSRIFDKPAFGSVELAEYIRDGGYEAVEMIGVCTDICVVSNALLVKAYVPEAAGFGGCVLLCWRHFREPSCGIMYNENVPDFSKIEKNMVKM